MASPLVYQTSVIATECSAALPHTAAEMLHAIVRGVRCMYGFQMPIEISLRPDTREQFVGA